MPNGPTPTSRSLVASPWLGPVAGLLAMAVLVVADALVGGSVVPMAAVVVAPLAAATTSRPGTVLAVTALAVLVAAVMGIADDRLGTTSFAVRLALVVTGGLLATVLSAAQQRTSERLRASERLALRADFDRRARRLAEAAREREGRLRALVEDVVEEAPMGLVILDADLRFVRINRELARVNGLPADAHLGRRVDEVVPDLPDEVVRLYERVVADGVAMRDVDIEVRPAELAGAVRHWRISLYPVPLPDGSQGVAAVLLDVTEHHDREQAMLVELERQRIVTKALQEAALPHRLPFDERLQVSAWYRPAETDQVGGDWYDAFWLTDTCLAVSCGDVAGHGSAAAGVMSQMRTALRLLSAEDDSPAGALDRLDRFLLDVLDEPRLVTAVLCYVDLEHERITWSRAGHPFPLLLGRSGPVFLEESVSPPLGVVGSPSATEAQRPFRPGERLLLYTDGLIETRARPIDRSLDRLRSCVEEGTSGADDLIRCVRGDAPQEDDACLLSVAFAGG